MTWQPIETAPKDGTWILLGCKLKAALLWAIESGDVEAAYALTRHLVQVARLSESARVGLGRRQG